MESHLNSAALEAAQRAVGMARRVGYTGGEHDRIGNIPADPIVEKAIRAYLDALSAPHAQGDVAGLGDLVWELDSLLKGRMDKLFTRDELGVLVRNAWVRWALAQPEQKPHWLLPYGELSDADKLADIVIGQSVAYETVFRILQRFTVTDHRTRLAAALPHSDGAVAEPGALRDDNLLLTYDAETRRVIVRRSVLRKGGDDQSLGYYTEVVGSGVLDFPWGGWKLVPVIPSEDQWNGLARSLVMWWGMSDRPTGQRLYAYLKLATARYIPDWLYEEIPDIDHVPPKGTVAACIYRAMIADAPASPINPVPAGVGDARLRELSKLLLRCEPLSDIDAFDIGVALEELQDLRSLRQAPDAAVA